MLIGLVCGQLEQADFVGPRLFVSSSHHELPLITNQYHLDDFNNLGAGLKLMKLADFDEGLGIIQAFVCLQQPDDRSAVAADDEVAIPHHDHPTHGLFRLVDISAFLGVEVEEAESRRAPHDVKKAPVFARIWEKVAALVDCKREEAFGRLEGVPEALCMLLCLLHSC